MGGLQRYAASLVFAVLAVAIILATHLLLDDVAWAGDYGPNLAASLIELFIAAGFLQLLVDRAVKRERAPMEKYAMGRVTAVLTEVVQLMRQVVRLAGAGPADVRTFSELRRRWPEALVTVDFEAAAQRESEKYLSALERIQLRADRAQTEHRHAAPFIGGYCDPRLAAALQEFMTGDDTRRVWLELRESLPKQPEGGWVWGSEEAARFAERLDECLRAYRDAADTGRIADVTIE